MSEQTKVTEIVSVQTETCIGCGFCVPECPRVRLSVQDGVCTVNSAIVCMECGHCVAVCPTNAIHLTNYDESEIQPYDAKTFSVPAENFLNALKFRRSLRKYQKRPVEKEVLDRILDAGRYSPTGRNAQGIRYIVATDQKMPELTKRALKNLYDRATGVIPPTSEADAAMIASYTVRWSQMYPEYMERDIDRLFFHAPLLIVMVARAGSTSFTQLDAGIAAANMEMMCITQGLGCCYIGLFNDAVEHDEELKKILGLKEKEAIVNTFVLGYPDIKFHRTVNRKKADVTVL